MTKVTKSKKTKGTHRAKRLPLVEMPAKPPGKAAAPTQGTAAPPPAKAECKDENLLPPREASEGVDEAAPRPAEHVDAADPASQRPEAPPVSAETIKKIVDDAAGPDEDDAAGVDAGDGRGIEDELESLISRLTDDMSELAIIKLLPRAKKLYEDLHPETKHGGAREEQVTKDGTCPTFAKFVAQRTGIAPSTVYNKLERAAELEALDREAEDLCYGTALANRIGLVIRVARIPKKELHRDFVNIFRNGGPKRAKEELEHWEDAFGLAKPASESVPPPPAEPTVEEVDADPDETKPEAEEPQVHAEELRQIMAALGVNELPECVPAIEQLKLAALAAPDLEQAGTLQTTIMDLRQQVAAAETTTKNLGQELKLYRTAPLGQLFELLGVKTAKDALRKAHELMENDNAAE